MITSMRIEIITIRGCLNFIELKCYWLAHLDSAPCDVILSEATTFLTGREIWHL
jgi:hypothetical protein